MRLLRRNLVTVTVLLLAGAAPSMAYPLGGPPSVAAPGVRDRAIKIGYHAPMTGASPLPSNSIQKGAEIYWRWRRVKDRPINRRHVNVVLKNDNYNPSQAVAVCKEMVEKDNVFMLSGLLNPEGKDQSQACARYAASVEVPYVALGQTKIGIKGLPNYFAFSMPWPQQGRLLAEYVIERLRGKKRKNGMLRHDTPNNQDTHDAFASAMTRRRRPLHYDRAVSRGAGQAEAQTVVHEMKAAGIDNVFILTTPVWFLQVLRAAGNQDYHPQWTGIGITMSPLDTVVEVGCRENNAIAGAKFFSPLPAFVDRNEFDRTYSRAMRRIHSGRGDAITWLGWATARHLAKLLDRAGRDLSRNRFVNRTERAKRVRTGIMPALNFRPRDHFGGRATHVLRARCSDGRWHTSARFKRDF